MSSVHKQLSSFINILCSGQIREYQREFSISHIPVVIIYLCSKFYEHSDYFDANNPWFNVSKDRDEITRIDDLSAKNRNFQRIYSVKTIDLEVEHCRQILNIDKYLGIVHAWRFLICKFAQAPDVDIRFGFASKTDLNIIDSKKQKFYGVMSRLCFDATRCGLMLVEMDHNADMTPGDIIELQIRFENNKCILLAFKNNILLKEWNINPDRKYKVFVSTNSANSIVRMLSYECANI